MAKQKDENNCTPFQVACNKLSQCSIDPLPVSLTRFILFLHKECHSNPNEPVYVKLSTNDEELTNNESDNVSEENPILDQEEPNKIKFIPIFKLVSNRCIDLFESLLNQSKDALSAIKIDFNVYNNNGLTPLLKSIVAGEFKFANKLIDLGLFNDSNVLKSQICKNSNLNESIIQLLIRNSQTDILSKIVDIMCKDTKNLVALLKHTNSYEQNFLHTLSFCSSANTFLNKLFKKLSSNLSKDEFGDCVLNLLKAKDILGRNPVHLCLLKSGRANIDLEIFLTEDIFSILDNVNISTIFADRDCFSRLPIHYLFYNSITDDLGIFRFIFFI